jgi:hypothetical protein
MGSRVIDTFVVIAIVLLMAGVLVHALSGPNGIWF